MYFASLLFCWVSIQGPQCLVAEDTYGPWPTNKDCLTRIDEMADKVRQEFPFADIRGRLCQPIMAGSTV